MASVLLLWPTLRPPRPGREHTPRQTPVEHELTDEAELVRRMLAGEERAFQAFFEHQFPRLYRFALPRVNRDPDAAREVVQATLTKAIRKLAAYRGDAALFTWLCQICRHAIVDYARAESRHTRYVTLIDDKPDLRAAIESIEAPDEYDL